MLIVDNHYLAVESSYKSNNFCIESRISSPSQTSLPIVVQPSRFLLANISSFLACGNIISSEFCKCSGFAECFKFSPNETERCDLFSNDLYILVLLIHIKTISCVCLNKCTIPKDNTDSSKIKSK